MSSLRIKNALLYNAEDRSFKKGGLTVENGKFAEIRAYEKCRRYGRRINPSGAH